MPVREGDLDAISAPLDVYGVNYYNPTTVAAAPEESPIPFEIVPTPGAAHTGFGELWPIVPEALTGLLVVIEPGGGTAETYAHPGHEFGLVLSGEIDLTIDGVVYRLKAGDSFAFKSTLRHGFRNPGEERCEIVWVNTVKPSEVRNGA